MYSLKDDLSTIIKGVDKGSVVVVVWNREDYLEEAYRQVDDKEVINKFQMTRASLPTFLMETLEKLSLTNGLSKDTLDYFFG